MKPQNNLFIPLLVVSGVLAPIIAAVKTRPSLQWLLVGAQLALLAVCVSIAVRNAPKQPKSPHEEPVDKV